MQTFLPYPNLCKSVGCLDDRRLGKQRVEAKQILLAIRNGSSFGWYNHPATQMWIGYEQALIFYMNCCIAEWVHRGYQNSMELGYKPGATLTFPVWLGDEKLHASHRSNLLKKDYEYYSQFGWTEPNDLPYFWPTKQNHCTVK